ncbi:MAG: DUF2061 domain-containing protein [Neisseria sp.]|uniref:DUF2061 domain-containing protein n=1 Tax=Neisseria sp. TaxID=192066 RepID=UPI0026DD9B30|nr:DUF2061 domain-containing protein [Neisseria sp.]MDO4641941.1 DUF2061 domain-containing protein [Neisseria sp.]
MLKTFTFAILHFCVAFSIAYLLTGSIGVSSALALVEPLANTVVFYFHDKAWNHYERKKGIRIVGKKPFPLHSCVNG